VSSPAQARQWVEQLESRVRFYKIGLELFLAGGFEVVEMVRGRGHQVMLDLKLFDVPVTVCRALTQLHGRGIRFATVHGNDALLSAAVAGKGDLQLLSVTALTSFDQNDLQQMGLSGSMEELVLGRARRALELGCDGIVSSGLEISRLRRELGRQLVIVTPGIRPGANREVAEDDQKRTMGPGEAIAAGADYVVVGRPIREAEDPLGMAASIQEEICAARSRKARPAPDPRAGE